MLGRYSKLQISQLSFSHMTRYTRRQKRSKNLMKSFLLFSSLHDQQIRRQSAKDHRLFRHLGQIQDTTFAEFVMDVDQPQLESEASSSSSSSSSTFSLEIDSDSDASTTGSSSLMDDSIFDNNSDTFSWSSFGLSDLDDNDSDSDDLPTLLSADDYLDSEDEAFDTLWDSDGDVSDSDTYSEFGDADNEADEDDKILPQSLKSRLASTVREEIEEMYSSRYEQPRTRFPRPAADLPHVLTVYKTQRPDHFRKALRVTPNTFDEILNKIWGDPVFSNNSQNEQMPVEHQLAIALYRFGHFGNAAGLDDISKWAGYATGTVLLATQRVMTAILGPSFLNDAVSLPTDAEIEEAKAWVESRTCRAWRNGWCMVDGTLVPLYERPYWFGESYFDRKSNYSLNIQVRINVKHLITFSI